MSITPQEMEYYQGILESDQELNSDQARRNMIIRHQGEQEKKTPEEARQAMINRHRAPESEYKKTLTLTLHNKC